MLYFVLLLVIVKVLKIGLIILFLIYYIEVIDTHEFCLCWIFAVLLLVKIVNSVISTHAQNDQPHPMPPLVFCCEICSSCVSGLPFLKRIKLRRPQSNFSLYMNCYKCKRNWSFWQIWIFPTCLLTIPIINWAFS